ncbi:MAG TPA: nitronate monooxygenase [Nitrososphaeraceae archaeon]|jgi:nitronate monooxygenase|nr:nitronate monooxygenase [Nitrososphaeraceae archaeon]
MNKLCKKLGIMYPVIQAGMAGGATTPELVSAVSNAGGLGILAASRLTPIQLKEAIQSIKSNTEKPFGVNILLAPPEEGNNDLVSAQQYLDNFRDELGLSAGLANISIPPSMTSQYLDVVFNEKIPVLSIGLGDPKNITEMAHSHGVTVMSMVTTVDEAIQVAKGGVDIVVAQGAEAGGHRSTFRLGINGEAALVGTLALVPQIVDAIPHVPVAAAGGIMDGRGLIAALALGASGVLIGTRFLVAKESGIFQAYKEKMFSSTEADTVITDLFTGRPARSIRNQFIEKYLESGNKPLIWPLQGLAADDIYTESRKRDLADYYPLLAGQGLRLLKRGQSAKDIVNEIVTAANSIISSNLIVDSLPTLDPK